MGCANTKARDDSVSHNDFFLSSDTGVEAHAAVTVTSRKGHFPADLPPSKEPEAVIQAVPSQEQVVSASAAKNAEISAHKSTDVVTEQVDPEAAALTRRAMARALLGVIDHQDQDQSTTEAVVEEHVMSVAEARKSFSALDNGPAAPRQNSFVRENSLKANQAAAAKKAQPASSSPESTSPKSSMSASPMLVATGQELRSPGASPMTYAQAARSPRPSSENMADVSGYVLPASLSSAASMVAGRDSPPGHLASSVRIVANFDPSTAAKSAQKDKEDKDEKDKEEAKQLAKAQAKKEAAKAAKAAAKAVAKAAADEAAEEAAKAEAKAEAKREARAAAKKEARAAAEAAAKEATRIEANEQAKREAKAAAKAAARAAETSAKAAAAKAAEAAADSKTVALADEVAANAVDAGLAAQQVDLRTPERAPRGPAAVETQGEHAEAWAAFAAASAQERARDETSVENEWLQAHFQLQGGSLKRADSLPRTNSLKRNDSLKKSPSGKVGSGKKKGKGGGR